MWLTLALLPSLAGCQGLDVVPVLEGSHCASPREEVVACTLDGDTFQVGTCGGESIRLLGVDAPEIAHNDSEVAECWGPESAAYLTYLLANLTIRLEFDTTCNDTYGRTLAYAWIPQGDPEDEQDDLLVNRDVIRRGMAEVYEDFDDIRRADQLYADQYAAQQSGLGLWSACDE